MFLPKIQCINVPLRFVVLIHERLWYLVDMKLFLSLVVLIAASGCTVVTTRPAPVVVVATAPSPSTQWNAALGLAAYPNSQLIDLDTNKDGSSKVTFTSRADFDDIYTYIHQQLSARGWQRTELDYKSKATKLEAKYRLNGRDFKLKLDAEGKSGRFKLEIDF
jgi:hypothetical protein